MYWEQVNVSSPTLKEPFRGRVEKAKEREEEEGNREKRKRRRRQRRKRRRWGRRSSKAPKLIFL